MTYRVFAHTKEFWIVGIVTADTQEEAEQKTFTDADGTVAIVDHVEPE